MRLLLVEDDEILGDALRAGLTQDGHAVDWASDGGDALAALTATEYAAVVLDLGLPRVSGLHVLTRLRAGGRRTPVLILTARDTVPDRVRGLDCGADDYMVKPFDLDELRARLRALLRRGGGPAAAVIEHDGIALDPAAHTVALDGEPVELSPREFAILHELLRHPGNVLSRERLEESLYGWNDEVASNAVEVHIHHLRRKLGADRIRTVRGAGYAIGSAAPAGAA
jgi:DNA-binding response OmpR family regulator